MIWRSKDDINRHMPEGFKKLYPSTRLILTCTQIFVQTPTSLLLQSQHYSTYKSNTTLKGLIGITPNGAIFMKWLAGLLPRQSFLKERENKCFTKLQELLLWLGGSATRQSDFFDYRATEPLAQNITSDWAQHSIVKQNIVFKHMRVTSYELCVLERLPSSFALLPSI